MAARTAPAPSRTGQGLSRSADTEGMRERRVRGSRKSSKCAWMYSVVCMTGEGYLDDDDPPEEPPEVVDMEIEDSLDLHAFAPRDVKDVVGDYLGRAAEKGFTEVRIIHGKGQGTLRRIVE